MRLEGWTWWIHPRYLEQLKEEIVPILSHTETLPGAILLKKTENRLIFKGNLNGLQEPIIIKAFKMPYLADKVKYFFRSSRGHKEYRVSLELSQQAISAPPVIAYGVSRRFGFLTGDILISREIGEAIPLSTWVRNNIVKGPIPFQGKKEIIKALASFVRRIHDNGVYSRDFHQGNILLKAKKDEPPQFYVTDLHSLGIKKRVSLRERIYNLAQLNDFGIAVKDRLRFLKYYLSEGVPLDVSIKGLASNIDSVSFTNWQHLWKKRKKKCLRPGKQLSVLQMGSWKGMIRKEYDTNEFLQLLCRFHPPLSKSNTQKIKESLRTSVTEMEYLDQGKSKTLIMKYYKSADFLSTLKELFRPSRAKRAWINAHNLLMRGIPTPLPLAFGEKEQWGLIQESFLITEKIPEAKASDIFLKELSGKPFAHKNLSTKNLFLVKLARMIQWMHQTGICHGDLKASNILVTMQDEEPSVMFVDVDGVKIRNKLRVKDIAKDLSRVSAAFSGIFFPPERDYLLALYGRGNRFFQDHKNKIVGKIHQLTAEKIRQKQRKSEK